MDKKRITAIVFASVLLAACSKNGQKAEEDDSCKVKQAFLNEVETVRAESTNQNEDLTLAGTVECDPNKVINYAPLVDGVVDRTYFMLGDKVEKGKTMLDIRSTELSSLESERISQESEKKIALRNLKTAEGMYKDGLLSEKELFEAQAKVHQAEAASAKVRTDMTLYGSNKGNGSFAVKAPLSGYVLAKNVSSGSTISAGNDPLFTIADLNTVWIVANVYANNLKFVRQGMAVEITSLSYPGEVFSGKIDAVSQVFDPEEKVLKARIVMPNKELKFKPQMAVVVRLKDQKSGKCIAIPSEALIFDNSSYFVVVQKSAKKFETRQVKLLGHHDERTYIDSGLSEGENVVTNNQLLIYSGLKEK
jgi:cobalt-zinc-cadmium efflux system membrane fusion protein